MPLPNTRLIHPGWQQHHQPPVLGQMTATCTIRRPAAEPTGWDDTTGTHTYPDPAVIYQGPCRVQRLAPGNPVTVADLTATVVGYRVTVPISEDTVRIGDMAAVDTCPHDLRVVGKTLLVRDVSGSSIAWQRDLTCDMQPEPDR